MAECLPEQFMYSRRFSPPASSTASLASSSPGRSGGQCSASSVSPAPARIFCAPATWKSSPAWLAAASASNSPSRSRPLETMATACIGLFDDRGKMGTSTAPAWCRRLPSGPVMTIAPRCCDSVKPDLTTSARTGFSWVIRGRILFVRAVVQRASEASVEVNGATVGSLPGPGLVVLVGVTHTDTPAAAAALARKIFYLRILRDERSCADTGAPLLVISQFTLYGDTRKGRRPTWQAAAPGPVADPLTELGASVQTGVFGANMQVMLVNDGPVTLILDAEPPQGAGG